MSFFGVRRALCNSSEWTIVLCHHLRKLNWFNFWLESWSPVYFGADWISSRDGLLRDHVQQRSAVVKTRQSAPSLEGLRGGGAEYGSEFSAVWVSDAHFSGYGSIYCT